MRDDSYALLWAPGPTPQRPTPPASLLPPDVLPLPVPVAVSVPQPSGGRMVLVSFPLRAASTPPPSVPQYLTVHRFMARVFQQLGLAP